MKFATSSLVVSLTAAALLVAPSLASARTPGRTFTQTFPHATALCARAASGALGTALTAQEEQVEAACTKLHTSFAAAGVTYTAATDPLPAQAKAAIAPAKAACATTAHTGVVSAACTAAVAGSRARLAPIRAAAVTASKAYVTSIKAARAAYWATIRTLRGGTAVAPDTTTPAPPIAPVLPVTPTVPAP
jgi:hypothetical protein